MRKSKKKILSDGIEKGAQGGRVCGIWSRECFYLELGQMTCKSLHVSQHKLVCRVRNLTDESRHHPHKMQPVSPRSSGSVSKSRTGAWEVMGRSPSLTQKSPGLREVRIGLARGAKNDNYTPLGKTTSR